jgi:hypothetical protein
MAAIVDSRIQAGHRVQEDGFLIRFAAEPAQVVSAAEAIWGILNSCESHLKPPTSLWLRSRNDLLRPAFSQVFDS